MRRPSRRVLACSACEEIQVMPEPTLEIESAGDVAWVWMNRPAVHNALNEAMIDELAETFLDLGEDPKVRAIVLAGRGKSFSAGGDIEYMKRQGAAPREINLATARGLAEMFHIIAGCPQVDDRARERGRDGRRSGPGGGMRHSGRIEYGGVCRVRGSPGVDTFDHRAIRSARHRPAPGQPAVCHRRADRCGACRTHRTGA